MINKGLSIKLNSEGACDGAWNQARLDSTRMCSTFDRLQGALARRIPARCHHRSGT
jgi:hypothetical protein